MKTIKYFMASALTIAMSGSSFYAMADVDLDDFVEEASERNMAEIEASRLALQKSKDPAVRAFAERMIADHTANNAELRSIATAKKVELEDEATLAAKAKAMILKQRDGESFDAAYANNQVTAHRDTVQYYQDAAKSENADVRTFATTTLPKLQHHLKEAEALASKLGANTNNNTRNTNINTNTSKPGTNTNTGTNTGTNTNNRNINDDRTTNTSANNE